MAAEPASANPAHSLIYIVTTNIQTFGTGEYIRNIIDGCAR